MSADISPSGSSGAASSPAPTNTGAGTPEVVEHLKPYKQYIALGAIAVSLFTAGVMIWTEYRTPVKVRERVTVVVQRSLADALALAESGRSQEALVELKRISADHPHNVEAPANLCGLYLELGRQSDARDACATALTRAPYDWFANYNQACVFARDGHTSAALQALGRALEYVEGDTAAKLTRVALAQKARTDPMLKTLHTDANFTTLVGTP